MARTKSQLLQQANTQNVTILQTDLALPSMLVTESSEFHLDTEQSAQSAFFQLEIIGVNRPAIVREIQHFGLFPAFPHFCKNVPQFWLYFEITKIAENRKNF